MTRFLLSLLQISLLTGALAGLVCLLSPFLDKRFSPLWRRWVWLILALRLIFPWTVSLPVSPVQLSLPQQAESVLSAPLPDPDAGAVFSETSPSTEMTAEPAPEPGDAAVRRPSPWQAAFALWLAGALAVLTVQVLGYARGARRVRAASQPVTDPAVLEFFQKQCAQAGLRRPVRLVLSQAVNSPMAMGWVRPVLVLPHLSWTPKALALVLRHELTHLRSGDLYLKALVCLAGAMHWFNPMAALMARRCASDLELICDYRVTRDLSAADKRFYSEIILTAAADTARTLRFSTALRSGKPALKARFANIFGGMRKKGTVWTVGVLALALLAGALIAWRTSDGGAQAAAADGPGTGAVQLAFTVGQDENARQVQVALTLPEGLSAVRDPDAVDYDVLNGSYGLYRDGQRVGGINVMEFSWYPDVDNYRAVYSSIMLGSMATYDNEYTPVKRTAYGETATCMPLRVENAQAYAGRMPDAPVTVRRGVLSYDTRSLCFAVLELEQDAITDAEHWALAQSVEMRFDGAAEPFSDWDEATAYLESVLSEYGYLSGGLLDGEPLSWDESQRFIQYVNGERAWVRYCGGGLYAAGTHVYRLNGAKWEQLDVPRDAAAQ